MQFGFARGLTMTDATAAGAQVSPIASAGTEASLTAPAKTHSLVVHAPSFAIELRLVAGGATLGKFTIPANTYYEIPCKAGDIFYFGRGAGNTTINFFFRLFS